MADTKLPEEDVAPEDLWTLIKQLRIRDIIKKLGIRDLIKQLRICDLINAIKQIVSDDFQHLTKVARGRTLSLKTFAILCKESIKTRTGCSALTTVAVVVCVILLVYPMLVVMPFLRGLGFTSVGPVAGSLAAGAQPASGVSAFFSTLQSAAMDGYGVPIVAAFVQGIIVAGIIFAVYKLCNMYKRKTA